MKIRNLVLGSFAAATLVQFTYAASNAAVAAVPAMPTAAQQCANSAQHYQVAVQFEQQMQKALMANDIGAFADLFTYPVKVNMGPSKRYYVHSIRDMMIRYPTLMTAQMKQQILADDPAQVFCNDQGVMIGNGAIWFKTNKTGTYGFIINEIGQPAHS